MSQIIRSKYGVILSSILISVIIVSVFTTAVATHPDPAGQTHQVRNASAHTKISTTNVWKDPSFAFGASNNIHFLIILSILTKSVSNFST